MARVPSASASSENPSRPRYSPTSSASSASSATRSTGVTELWAVGEATALLNTAGPATARSGRLINVKPSERHGQRLQTSQRQARPILRLIRGQRPLWQAAQQRVDGDLTLDARQRSAETEVDAPAERDVTIVGAADVEPVGVRKLRGVAVGGAGD